MDPLATLRRRLPAGIRRPLAVTAEHLVAVPMLPALAAVAVLARLRRSPRRERPRIVWGPEPILSYRHWSRALRKAGYESETVMQEVYSRINRAEDFDVLYEQLVPPGLAFLLGPYAAFVRSLFRADVFQHHYSGGFLGLTPLWRLEGQLLHLAGARVVSQAHGNDAHLSSQIADLSLRHALLSSYPMLARREARTRRRVMYWTEHADCMFGGLMMDGLGRWDVLPASVATIDVAQWRRERPYSRADGRSAGPVRVAHAPNHRGFKGTEFIISAAKQLRAEGLDVELVLIEGVQNREVRRILTTEVDVLADQIIATGYALNAIEGMAAGLPVVANLEDDRLTAVLRRYSYLDECPILSASPETIADRLRALVVDPDLRERLGRAAAAYAAKYHSDETAAYLYGAIYRQVWNGEPVALIDLFHPLKSEYSRSRPRIEHGLVRNRIGQSVG
ncbi:MAG TPA: glycosyltransferase [Solirubrobacteraceae bacterium]|nr:glycosyltransferase [Solirubrobacteraceae bacterium]